MFKIPNWENDVPKAIEIFAKKAKTKKDTLTEKSSNINNCENNEIKKNVGLNGINKPIIKKTNDVKNGLKQISENGRTKNYKVKKGKNKLQKEISKDIRRIRTTIRSVETNNNESEKQKKTITGKVVKPKLKKIKKNGPLLNTHKEIQTTANNSNSVDQNFPNHSVVSLKNGVTTRKKNSPLLNPHKEIETTENNSNSIDQNFPNHSVVSFSSLKNGVTLRKNNSPLLNPHKEIETTDNNSNSVGQNFPNHSVISRKNGTTLNKKSKTLLQEEADVGPSKNNIQSNVNRKEIKRKHNNENETSEGSNVDSSSEEQNLNSDLLDEALINMKKKKLTEAFAKDDREDLLFAETDQSKTTVNNNKEYNSLNCKTVFDKKKENIKKALQKESNRRSLNISGNKLRSRMLERLKAAQFRYLNEKLYTSSGVDAQKLFQNDPAAFQTYHEGYQQQLKKWPVNPLDVIVKRIRKMPKSYTIADMGCGEAALSRGIPNTVRSFDLVATAPGVETCDMAHTPLLAASTDVAVYCLALMGTDLTQYLVEANRILKIGGHLLIAEVESRFDKVEDFTREVERLGFKLKNLDKSNSVFFFMEFTKIRDPPVKKSKLPMLTLKPCMYKKR